MEPETVFPAPLVSYTLVILKFFDFPNFAVLSCCLVYSFSKISVTLSE